MPQQQQYTLDEFAQLVRDNANDPAAIEGLPNADIVEQYLQQNPDQRSLLLTQSPTAAQAPQTPEAPTAQPEVEPREPIYTLEEMAQFVRDGAQDPARWEGLPDLDVVEQYLIYFPDDRALLKPEDPNDSTLSRLWNFVRTPLADISEETVGAFGLQARANAVRDIQMVGDALNSVGFDVGNLEEGTFARVAGTAHDAVAQEVVRFAEEFTSPLELGLTVLTGGLAKLRRLKRLFTMDIFGLGKALEGARAAGDVQEIRRVQSMLTEARRTADRMEVFSKTLAAAQGAGGAGIAALGGEGVIDSIDRFLEAETLEEQLEAVGGGVLSATAMVAGGLLARDAFSTPRNIDPSPSSTVRDTEARAQRVPIVDTPMALFNEKAKTFRERVGEVLDARPGENPTSLQNRLDSFQAQVETGRVTPSEGRRLMNRIRASTQSTRTITDVQIAEAARRGELPPVGLTVEQKRQIVRAVDDTLQELRDGRIRRPTRNDLVNRLDPEMEDGINRVDPLARLGVLQEFVGSPSQQFSKVHSEAGRLVKSAINTENRLNLTREQVEIRLRRNFQQLEPGQYDRLVRLLDDPEVTGNRLFEVAPDLPDNVSKVYLDIEDLLENQRVRLRNALRQRSSKPFEEYPDNWGVRRQLWPHAFDGQWRIDVRNTQGKWTPALIENVEGGHIAHTQRTALGRARTYLDEHPGAELIVRPDAWDIHPQELGMWRSNQFSRFLKYLDNITLDNNAIRQASDIPVEQARILGAENGLDVPGFRTDPSVLANLINATERKIHMLEFNGIANDIRRKLQRTPTVDRHFLTVVDDYINTFNGQEDRLTRALNSRLRSLGLVERMLGTKPVQRLNQFVTKAQAMLKMGWRPSTAVTNMTQTITNTYPVLGAKYTHRGLQGYLSRKYHGLLEDIGLLTEASRLEDGAFQHIAVSKVRRGGGLRFLPEAIKDPLWMFRKVEEGNRSVAFIGALERSMDNFQLKERDFTRYQAGIKLPLKTKERVEAAIQEATDVVTRTQFIYSAADAPIILRSPATRALTQFKTFYVKELEFMFGLKGREILRFFGALGTIGGVGVVPGTLVMNEIVGRASGFYPVDWARVRLEGGGGEEAERAVKAIVGRHLLDAGARGIMSPVAGVDLSRQVGVGDWVDPAGFTDLQLAQLAGPTGTDLMNGVVWLWHAGLRGRGSRESREAATRLIRSLSPGARSLMDALAVELDQNRRLVDPFTGSPRVEDISRYEQALILGGFTPKRVSQETDIVRGATAANQTLTDQLSGTYRDLVEAIDADNNERIEELVEQAVELGSTDIGEGVSGVRERQRTTRVQQLVQRIGPRRTRILREKGFLPEQQAPPPPPPELITVP